MKLSDVLRSEKRNRNELDLKEDIPMSPKVKLFLAGIMPLIVGYIMNYVIIYLPFSGVIINVI